MSLPLQHLRLHVLNTSLLKRQVLVHSASRAVDLLPRRPDRAYVASRIATSRDGDDHLKEREEREDFCVSRRRRGGVGHVNN